ncbi:MAG TPA: ABC transporter substrate-binding protein [Methylomirabilota bacterium]|jgi:phospholipid transport system substrate-binding protein
MRHHQTILISLFVIAFSAAVAVAGAPTEQLRGQIDKVIKILDDPALKDRPGERRTQVRKLAEDIFDYPDTARRALGPHWNGRTPQEREEFTRLFADLLDRAYISKIDLYQGEKVKYVGETINGDESIVKTTIATKSNTEVPVDYRMHQKDGRWRVYDVIIEGVSLVSNYRTQFNKIVQTESYDSLVQKLKNRAATPAASPR